MFLQREGALKKQLAQKVNEREKSTNRRQAQIAPIKERCKVLQAVSLVDCIRQKEH